MSMIEILIKAGTDTLLGMGTVFAMLVLISLVIYLFKFISKEPALAENKPVEEAAQTGETENEQLIAVIMAAIAAYDGKESNEVQNPCDYVVKSVKRRR